MRGGAEGRGSGAAGTEHEMLRTLVVALLDEAIIKRHCGAIVDPFLSSREGTAQRHFEVCASLDTHH